MVASGSGSRPGTNPHGLAWSVRTAVMRPRLGKEYARALAQPAPWRGTRVVTTAGVRSTFAPPDTRPPGTGRNGQGRRVTADAAGRPFVHVTGDSRGQVGMGRDPRGDGGATCKIAGIVYAGRRPPRYQQCGMAAVHCQSIVAAVPLHRREAAPAGPRAISGLASRHVVEGLACLVDVANAWHILQIESPRRAPCHRGRQDLRGRSC
jgi:hypothetical protein